MIKRLHEYLLQYPLANADLIHSAELLYDQLQRASINKGVAAEEVAKLAREYNDVIQAVVDSHFATKYHNQLVAEQEKNKQRRSSDNPYQTNICVF